MSRIIQAGQDNIQPVKADGTYAAVDDKGFLLVAGATYYVDLGGKEAPIYSVQFAFAAALVITSLEIEDCNFPGVSLTSSNSSRIEWVKENPPTAYVAAVGAGVTPTLLTVTKAAGAIGGAMIHIGNTGALRNRAKIIVGAAGGVVSIATSGKN